MTHHGRRLGASRGVAMVMAIALLGLVAVILTAVAVRTRAEFTRTVLAAEDAQASQLLIAGAEAARAQHAAGTRVDGPIVTPVGHVAVTWRRDVAGHACTIDATLPHLTRSVELTLAP